MSEPFIASIIMFGGNFAPKGWAFCNGQIMPIAQNTALFSILGTTYGGNGQTTFALPDMRSRVPLHPGTGSGLSNYALGQMSGTENTTLTANQLAPHGHNFNILANEGDPNSKVPLNAFFANQGSNFYNTAQDGTKMGTQVTDKAGGAQPVPVIQPILAVNFIIALVGIFPSRN
jgi:microcystin-dependent protein